MGEEDDMHMPSTIKKYNLIDSPPAKKKKKTASRKHMIKDFYTQVNKTHIIGDN